MGNRQKTVLAAVAVVALIGFFWLLLWLRPDPDARVGIHKTRPAPVGQGADAGGSPSENRGAGGGGEMVAVDQPGPATTAPAAVDAGPA